MKKNNTFIKINIFKIVNIISFVITIFVLVSCKQNLSKKDNLEPLTPVSKDKIYTVGNISFTMKHIDAVTDAEVGHNDIKDNKPHKVSLSSYMIGETLVTQELWKIVNGKNPSHYTKHPSKGEIQEKRPVEKISWYDCIAFCNELTKKIPQLGEKECVYYLEDDASILYTVSHAKANKNPIQILEKKGFRLPTEAEWEWAAKGDGENKWAGTDDESSLKEYAWYSVNSGKKTHEVKKKKSNCHGLYDMTGNVWEWCWDWYKNQTPESGENPVGASDGISKALHGGSWYNISDQSYIAYRSYGRPHIYDRDVGIRLVRRD